MVKKYTYGRMQQGWVWHYFEISKKPTRRNQAFSLCSMVPINACKNERYQLKDTLTKSDKRCATCKKNATQSKIYIWVKKGDETNG